jgi:hypothetical protein
MACYSWSTGAVNISITPELEKFVDQEVKSGLYQSASEVIRAGLRRLKEDKELNRASWFLLKPNWKTNCSKASPNWIAAKGFPVNRSSPISKLTAIGVAPMSELVVAPAARADSLAQWNYCADEVGRPDLADRFTAQAETTFKKLVRTPGFGRPRSFRQSLKW